MTQKIEDILDICLEEIKQGKTVQECLSKYPQFAAQLKPLLEFGNKIGKLPQPQISHEALLSTLIEVGRVSAIENQKKNEHIQKSFFNFRPIIIRVAVAISIMIIIGWTTLKLSATSFPGDFLYPLKLITEKVRYMLTLTPEGKVEMRITFSEERLKELIKTVQTGSVLDKKVVSMMLDEARLALNKTSFLPQEKASYLLKKIEQLNNYQKDTLEKIKPQVRPEQEELINTAIEMCGERSKWINKMCGEDNDTYRGMRCP